MQLMVELGRIDIVTEVSMLSSYLAYQHKGHFETTLHVMGYLRLKHNTRLNFDPTYPDIDLTVFPQYEWTMPHWCYAMDGGTWLHRYCD
jgi:hypothetical protein